LEVLDAKTRERILWRESEAKLPLNVEEESRLLAFVHEQCKAKPMDLAKILAKLGFTEWRAPQVFATLKLQPDVQINFVDGINMVSVKQNG
jgi:hypothetical protein